MSKNIYSHVAEVGVLSKSTRLDHLQVAVHDGSEIKMGTNLTKKNTF